MVLFRIFPLRLSLRFSSRSRYTESGLFRDETHAAERIAGVNSHPAHGFSAAPISSRQFIRLWLSSYPLGGRDGPLMTWTTGKPMFTDDDLCPCASGLVVRDCTCKPRKFVPCVAGTQTPGGRNGRVVRGCYAGPLRDCAPPISAEHPVSESAMLEVISGRTVRLLGDRWRARGLEGRVIGLKSLTKRVLCKRHNSALSSLDSVGAAFTRSHAELMIHLHEGKRGDYHRLFNGYDVERWMLKILCAQQHEERIPGSDDLKLWRVPRTWLEILFHGAPFAPGAGLYSPKHPVPELRGWPCIGTARTYFTRRPVVDGLPIVGRAVKDLAGIQVSILGIAWELLMERPPNPAEYVYRPRMTRFPDPATARVAQLHIGWDEHPPTFAGKRAYRQESGFS